MNLPDWAGLRMCQWGQDWRMGSQVAPSSLVSENAYGAYGLVFVVFCCLFFFFLPGPVNVAHIYIDFTLSTGT